MASRQHGVVSHRQLAALGLGRSAIRHRLDRGRLQLMHRGVYAVGRPAVGAHAAFIAAVFACGPRALLSHRSAAELWGLWRGSGSRIDVTVAGSTRHDRGRLVIHRARALHPEDRALVDNIPVTSLARTMLDFAAVAPRQRQVERALEEAERRQLFDLWAVERVLGRCRGHHGAGPLRAAIAEAAHSVPWTRSELEHQFLRFCRERGLPQPAVNQWVEKYEVDALWEEAKVIVELDSWTHHGPRPAFESDRKRDIKLHLARYRPIRVTQRRIEREADELEQEIRGLLALGRAA